MSLHFNFESPSQFALREVRTAGTALRLAVADDTATDQALEDFMTACSLATSVGVTADELAAEFQAQAVEFHLARNRQTMTLVSRVIARAALDAVDTTRVPV